MAKYYFLILGLCALSFICPLAQGATVALGTSGDDVNNYGTFSGQDLQSVTLNGITYLTSDLIQITMTGFVGGSTGQLLQTNGGSANPTAQERRDFIETDWSGNTGIINPATSADSFLANFNAPVQNIAGVDMFLYEINSGATGDAFDITINATTIVVNGSDYGDSGVNTASADVLNFGGAASNLSDLLTDPTSLGSNAIDQNLLGVGIDFSDFGVADGAFVSSFSMSSNGSNTFDPVIVAAIPEPSTSLLLFLALGGLVALRKVQQ